MAMINKYIKRSRISESKFRQLLRLFCLDIDARKIAKLTWLNRNTVTRYIRLIRERIVELCNRSSPFSGEVEVDESYFGARRIKGKRGRGAGGKTPVFGILQRGGKVYTEIVPNCARKTLQAIIRGKVNPDSIIHSDPWRGYNGLVDMGYKKTLSYTSWTQRIRSWKKSYNGTESFWSYAKRRLEKFHRFPKSTFNLHLKECEFRFNNRN